MLVDVFVRTGRQPQLCADRPKAFQQRNKILGHIRRIKIAPQFAGLLPLRQQAGDSRADCLEGGGIKNPSYLWIVCLLYTSPSPRD